MSACVDSGVDASKEAEKDVSDVISGLKRACCSVHDAIGMIKSPMINADRKSKNDRVVADVDTGDCTMLENKRIRFVFKSNAR